LDSGVQNGKSNRLDKVKDYGFDIGGPIIKDKLFAWGAYHKNDIGLITAAQLPDHTKLDDINIKGNFNWNAANESQFGYFRGGKVKNGRLFTGVPTWQAEATLWDQGNSKNILNGIWTGQHTWIPNDHTIVTGRYGYIGNGFGLIPRGGRDIPMIVMGSVPYYEDTGIWYTTDRPTHDITVDANYYKEKLLGGDHEFKFGFEYRTGTVSSLSTYGNGVYVYDYAQTSTDLNAPLIGGNPESYVGVYHDINDKVKQPRQSLYVTDTYRKSRLTLNLGFRWDRQTGTNLATTVRPVPGFEFLGGINFAGNDPGIVFNDYSPRIGATYDITGDGKTIIRGNYARYGDIWGLWQNWLNPTAVFNGVKYGFTNLNGDRVITPNELTWGPEPFGGMTASGFDMAAFMNSVRIDPSFHNGHSNEYIVGFERQVMQDISMSVQYTYRNYPDTYGRFPDVSPSQLASLYQPDGNRTFTNVLGSFTVPVYLLNPDVAAAIGDKKVLATFTGVNQIYNGVDINVRKRMSHNFMINTSLVLQRQKQKYSSLEGTAQLVGDTTLSGNPYPWNPGIAAFLNNQPYAYGPTSSGKSGTYPYSEWQLKVSGVYQFPYDINVGAYVRYQQGYPYVVWGAMSDPNGVAFMQTSTDRILLEDFGSRRFDNMFSMDLQFEKAFKIQQYGKLTVSANIFNLFNANTVLRRSLGATSSSFNNIVENLSPRAVRLGVRYNF
jgi:hypothetical protein